MPEFTKSGRSDYTPRAPRFPIQTPLHFRESGQIGWYEATTVNISRTGILFRTDRDLMPQTVLEMRIVFPAEITGDTPMNVVCWGPVVRREVPAAADSGPALAAAILRYRLSHD